MGQVSLRLALLPRQVNRQMLLGWDAISIPRNDEDGRKAFRRRPAHS